MAAYRTIATCVSGLLPNESSENRRDALTRCMIRVHQQTTTRMYLVASLPPVAEGTPILQTDHTMDSPRLRCGELKTSLRHCLDVPWIFLGVCNHQSKRSLLGFDLDVPQILPWLSDLDSLASAEPLIRLAHTFVPAKHTNHSFRGRSMWWHRVKYSQTTTQILQTPVFPFRSRGCVALP